MARSTKKKLAIFAGTTKCLIYAEAKYCASEMPGEIKYYECSRTEYCCALGCCVSPVLHFHHLWYYWILVIIMFLVCSGGGWWYRYWFQGRHRAAASAIPNRSSNTRAQNALRGPTCQAQRARITYNSARNTVLLHRMWKGPQRNGAAPAYSGNATTSSSHYQNMSVVLNDAVNCPYYQLYGPPPSYETVIAQSRGKHSNPASPESSNARLNLPSGNVMPSASIPQCFSYACNQTARLPVNPEESSQYQAESTSPRSLENHETVAFPHFPQYCATGGILRSNVCMSYPEYPERYVPSESFARVYQANAKATGTYVPMYPMDKSSDTSDAEIQSYEVPCTERYTMLNIDATASSSRDDVPWESGDRAISKMHVKLENGNASGIEGRQHTQQTQQTQETPESGTMFSEMTRNGHRDDTSDLRTSVTCSAQDFSHERDSISRERSSYGGSFKCADRYTRHKYEGYTVRRAFSRSVPRSCEEILNSELVTLETESRDVPGTSRMLGDGSSTSPFQSNPSNNVILESFVSNLGNEEEMEEEEGRPRPMNASTNSDIESKHRLDRSKSLD